MRQSVCFICGADHHWVRRGERISKNGFDYQQLMVEEGSSKGIAESKPC